MFGVIPPSACIPPLFFDCTSSMIFNISALWMCHGAGNWYCTSTKTALWAAVTRRLTLKGIFHTDVEALPRSHFPASSVPCFQRRRTYGPRFDIIHVEQTSRRTAPHSYAAYFGMEPHRMIESPDIFSALAALAVS